MLTIDRSLQYETERALGEEIVSSHAKGGIAVVTDPTTGEILAMANLVAGPDGPRPAVNNAAVTNVYEPGSVNKVVTIAGALEQHLIAPSSVFAVPDHLKVADAMFSEHDPHPVKQWNVTDIVSNSSNIGTIMIGERLGKNAIDRYLRAFGLGAKTGLSFPGESAGILLDPKLWSGTSIGTVPIGNGLAVTALQMLDVYNTIGNGGVFVAPSLVKGTVDGLGGHHAAPPNARRRVISALTAHELTAMLQQVVRVGTGTAAAINGYDVAGKTGTARKPREGARGYQAGAYVATFAGFVPAERPRLSAIVVLDQPTPIYGGLVSAPVFARVAGYGLRLLDIPPPEPRTAPRAAAVTTPTTIHPSAELDGVGAARGGGPGTEPAHAPTAATTLPQYPSPTTSLPRPQPQHP